MFDVRELTKMGITADMPAQRFLNGDYRRLDHLIDNAMQENNMRLSGRPSFRMEIKRKNKQALHLRDEIEETFSHWGDVLGCDVGMKFEEKNLAKVSPPPPSVDSGWSDDEGDRFHFNAAAAVYPFAASPCLTLSPPLLSKATFPPVFHFEECRPAPKFTPSYDFHFGSVIKSGTPDEIMAFKIKQMIEQNNVALQALTDRTGMPITQENGQRRYGPPRDFQGQEPSKGCEIFIGKLPRDCYEPEIVPIVEKVGKIYELRLMMDFSGTNRGYCFVKFHTHVEALEAVRKLDNFEIRKGRRIGVLKSVDNCRLFLGGIPREKSKQEIFEEMSKITKGVRDIICYPSVEDKTKNRGFAFVEYDSHRSAAMARRKMLPKKIPVFGVMLCCDWAEPLPDVDTSVLDKVTNLFVRNLMLSTTEETLAELFNKYSTNGVEKVKKIDDYAFVHFKTREEAEVAMRTLDQTEIEGSKVEITWAKPVDRDTYKVKKAMARSLQASRNMQGVQGHGRQIFGVYSGGNQAPDVTLPIPVYNNGPLITGMQSFEQQVAALETSLAAQKFFPAPVTQQSRAVHGRAAGVHNLYLGEHSNALQHSSRKPLPLHGPAPNGYYTNTNPYMFQMQNPYYHPLMLHQYQNL